MRQKEKRRRNELTQLLVRVRISHPDAYPYFKKRAALNDPFMLAALKEYEAALDANEPDNTGEFERVLKQLADNPTGYHWRQS